jgi:hypothetical protein
MRGRVLPKQPRSTMIGRGLTMELRMSACTTVIGELWGLTS